MAVYFIFELSYRVKEGVALEWLCTIFSWKNIVKLIFLNDLDIINAGHLWFLLALIYAYVCFIIVHKMELHRILIKSLPILLLARVVLRGLFVNSNWHMYGNFLFAGIPFMGLGLWIAMNETRLKDINTYKLYIIGGVGFLYSLFGVFNYRLDFSEIGVIVFSFCLFIIAIKKPNCNINSTIATIGELYSIYVYIFHILINNILNYLLTILGIERVGWISWIYPIFVVIISIAVAKVLTGIISVKKSNH